MRDASLQRGLLRLAAGLPKFIRELLSARALKKIRSTTRKLRRSAPFFHVVVCKRMGGLKGFVFSPAICFVSFDTIYRTRSSSRRRDSTLSAVKRYFCDVDGQIAVITSRLSDLYISYATESYVTRETLLFIIIYRFKNCLSPIITSVFRDYHCRGSRIKRNIRIKSNCVSLRRQMRDEDFSIIS